MSKPIILIFLSGYLPGKNYGGPVVSVENMINACKDQFQFKIITSDHDLGSTEKYKNISNDWNNIGYAKVKYLTKREQTLSKIINILKEEIYDLIYLNSFFYAKFSLPVFMNAKKLKKPILCAPRGELCNNAFAQEKLKKFLFLKLLKLIGVLKEIKWQATGEDELFSIIDKVSADKENIYLVEDLTVINDNKSFSKKKHLKILKIVFISRIHPNKNLIQAIKYVQCIKNNAQFDIYGPVEDILYWKKCIKLIAKNPSNIKIRYCGTIEHSNVLEVLKHYDVFLMPTLSENYGHAIVEAMLANCPVVISDQTPWTDIREHNAGYSFELTDHKGFIAALNEICEMDRTAYNQLVKNCKNYIKKKLNIERIIQKHKEMFFNLLDTK